VRVTTLRAELVDGRLVGTRPIVAYTSGPIGAHLISPAGR